MKKWLYGLFALLLVIPAAAQLSVVRVDGSKIYLDTSEEKMVPVKGSTFKVIVSSETLTNPKTGKNLGQIYHYSDTGTITEVQPLYVVGELTNTTGVTVGKQAVWETPAAPVVAPAKEASQVPTNVRKKITYQPVEQTVISLTQANVTAPGAQNIITLSDKNQVTVFSRAPKETLTPQLTFELPSGKKGLAVSAAPVKEGLAQIFVAVYTEQQGKISTLVLENKNGSLVQTETLPYYVKELGCANTKKIWAQRPFVLGSTPGNAREVVFEKGKFAASGNTFNTKHNWLEGLNFYPVETADKNNLITTASNGLLRITLNNGKIAESKDLFGSTPLRVSYKHEILKFYPSLQVFGKPGQITLAAVENGAKFGLLSEAFGQYQAGKIHFLTYEKGRLQITDTTELDGVLYDTACTDTSILTAEALPNGTSTVVEILK